MIDSIQSTKMEDRCHRQTWFGTCSKSKSTTTLLLLLRLFLFLLIALYCGCLVVTLTSSVRLIRDEQIRHQISQDQQIGFEHHHHHQQQQLPQIRSNAKQQRHLLPPTLPLQQNEVSYSHGLVVVEGNSTSNATLSLSSTEFKRPLWEQSTILPSWMKDYFVWHRQQRQFLQRHPEQWNNVSSSSLRYYLVECTERYPNCGGTADRLGPLPFHVQFAAASRRLLLYHWTTPAPLESFLLPPQEGSVDWRVPAWLQYHFDDNLHFPSSMRNRRRRKTSNVTVALDVQDLLASMHDIDNAPLLVRTKIQLHDHGAGNYNDMVFWNEAASIRSNGTASSFNDVTFSHQPPQQPSFQQVYHDLWRVFFTPTPAIASKIQEQVTSNMGLYPPGSYIAMHLRLLYGKTPLSDAQIVSWTRNMIHCTLQHLVPQMTRTLSSSSQSSSIPPLLFVSDSIQATKEAVAYGNMLQIPLVVRSTATKNTTNPLHLEKDVPRAGKNSNSTLQIEQLYDTFVDIYTVGMSGCVAYQAGGFGRWGSMMSYNASCKFFLKPGQPEICPRPTNLDEYAKSGLSRTKGHIEPLFLAPMQLDEPGIEFMGK